MTGFSNYRMPKPMWARMSKLIPVSDPSPKGGRPRRKNLRDIADGIFYKLRTGCQWKAVPRCFGPPSTIHDYFTRWVEQGVFEKLRELALKEYDDLRVVR